MEMHFSDVYGYASVYVCISCLLFLYDEYMATQHFYQCTWCFDLWNNFYKEIVNFLFFIISQLTSSRKLYTRLWNKFG